MKKFISIITVLMASVSTGFATGQMSDHLLYKGETVMIFSNPLESYFDKDHPRPDKLFRFSCTACWRGYVATWKIEKDELYLVKLDEGSCDENPKKIPLKKVFPEAKDSVKATWFSGVIRIPQGKQLMYVHMGYGSIYEKDLFLTFEKGKLIKEEIVDNTKKVIPTGDERTLDELQKLKEWEDGQKK
jgi:hypothetical protein